MNMDAHEEDDMNHELLLDLLGEEKIDEISFDGDFKLDPKIKADWLSALRGGKYRQGRSWLRTNDDKFCCLGVLSDICPVVTPERSSSTESWYYGTGSAVPDLKVLAWAAPSEDRVQNDLISPTVMFYWTYDGQRHVSWLATMNDNGATFNQIADIIERGF